MVELLVVVFLFLLGLALLAFVLQPLLSGTMPEELAEGGLDRLEELYARRDALYQAIRDLEADYQVGKVTEEDYQRFRQQLRREAAQVLQEIDDLLARSQDVWERLEAHVAALREKWKEAPAEGRAQPRFCAQCGHPVWPGDRFCSQCGAPVSATLSTSGPATHHS